MKLGQQFWTQKPCRSYECYLITRNRSYECHLEIVVAMSVTWKVPDGMIDAGHCTSCVL